MSVKVLSYLSATNSLLSCSLTHPLCNLLLRKHHRLIIYLSSELCLHLNPFGLHSTNYGLYTYESFTLRAISDPC